MSAQQPPAAGVCECRGLESSAGEGIAARPTLIFGSRTKSRDDAKVCIPSDSKGRLRAASPMAAMSANRFNRQ
jgi:hypothetical protein